MSSDSEVIIINNLQQFTQSPTWADKDHITFLPLPEQGAVSLHLEIKVSFACEKLSGLQSVLMTMFNLIFTELCKLIPPSPFIDERIGVQRGEVPWLKVTQK